MPKTASKLVIAVDIDDVIVAEAEFIVEYSNKYWGHALSIDDYKEHWSDMWQVDHAETERRADILHSPGMVTNYLMIENAHQALEELAKNFRLVILTSRRKVVKEETLNWLSNNFAGLFDEVHFTGFWDSINQGSHLLTKADLTKAIGAQYLIDDQPKHCFAAAEAGVKAVLFGNGAESRNLKLPEGVTRCKNWQEVLEYFNGRC